MRRPFPGLLLVRRAAASDTLAGGIVQLLPGTLKEWTLGQAEVLAVGELEQPEDPEDEPIPLDPAIKPGAWVLTRFRNWYQTDKADEFLVRQVDVIGVFNDLSGARRHGQPALPAAT